MVYVNSAIVLSRGKLQETSLYYMLAAAAALRETEQLPQTNYYVK